MLEAEGIVISIAAAVDIEKILANSDIEKLKKISELKYVLSPLLCRNKEDQEKVYKLFDKLDTKVAEEYKKRIEETVASTIVEKNRNINWKKFITPWYFKRVILPAALILLVLLLVYLFRDKLLPPNIVSKKVSIITGSQQIVVNDTVLFSAAIDSSIVKNKVTVDWKLSDTVITNKLSVTIVVRDTTAVNVIAFLKNAAAVIIDSDTFSMYPLCELPPSVAIEEVQNATTTELKTDVNKSLFEAVFKNGLPDKRNYQYKWYVNDSLSSRDSVLNYTKPYNKIKLVVGCTKIHCSTDSMIAQIESVPALHATITGDRNLKIESAYNLKNIFTSLVLLLLVPAIIALLVFRIILSIKSYVPEINAPKPGTEGPFRITFKDQQHHINTESGVRRLADVLRKRQVSDMYRLNLRKTIRSTVVAGGIPKLEFSPLSKPVNYLVFIDKEKQNSFLVKLFEYLVEKLQKQEVNIFVYEYFKEPLFLSNEKLNHHRIPLEKIAALYPDTTLFIFGDAQYFLLPLKGTVKQWVTRKLNNWPIKILITPYSKPDWDKKEKLLIESNFVVLPADLSFLPVIEKIICKQIDIPAQKKESIENAYRSRFLNLQDFETLKNYLGEAAMLQWVCSLAIYPAADWDFTIAMGKAIEQRLQQNGMPAELVNYTNLLKIGRISWLQDGIVNESLRAQMLTYLDKDSEALARETLSTQLHLIEDTITDDSLVKANFDMHQKLNRFLLDSYNQKKIAKQDEAFIKRSLKFNRIDEGQDIYLEAGNNSMLSHPDKNGQEVGLSRYFKLRTYREILNASGYGLVVLATLVTVSYILLKNNSPYLNWTTAKPVAQIYNVAITGGDISKEIIFNLYYEPTHTKWRENKFLLANTNDTFVYNDIAVTDTNAYGLVKITAKDGKLITADSFKLNSAIYNITIKEVQKIPLKIFYKDAASLALANTMVENLPANFNVSIRQQSWPDTAMASVFYFSKDHKEDGLLAASVVNSLLNINIQPRQVDSLNSAQASVIIYINMPALNCTPVAITALPKSLNEIWHGGNSNRLININLAKKVMYYSVNDTKTFGTYGIEDICFTKNGAYKIITKTNQGYKLSFIRNVKPQSFELSICQNFVQTKAELENKDESYCDRFNLMSFYYERNRSRIYLPVTATKLQPAESAKIRLIADSFNLMLRQKKQLKITTAVYENNKYSRLVASVVIKYLPENNLNYDLRTDDWLAIPSPNPFERSYITIATNIISPIVAPDCGRVFYSLKEAMSVNAVVICNLDLSNENLSTMPKEVYGFKNLKQLILGKTAIPSTEIVNLQKSLPRCKIEYTEKQQQPEPPQNQQQQAKDTTFRQLRILYFNSPGKLNGSDRVYLNSVVKNLTDNYDAAIRLVAYYEYDGEKQMVIENINAIKNYIFSGKAGKLIPARQQVEERILKGTLGAGKMINKETNETSFFKTAGFKEIEGNPSSVILFGRGFVSQQQYNLKK